MVGPSLCVRVWLMVIALSFSPICFASFVRMICKKQPLSVAQLPNEQHLCKINSTQHTNAIFFSPFSAIMIKSFKYHFHKQGAHVSGSACVCTCGARKSFSVCHVVYLFRIYAAGIQIHTQTYFDICITAI